MNTHFAGLRSLDHHQTQILDCHSNLDRLARETGLDEEGYPIRWK
jgi:hypothetical protein